MCDLCFVVLSSTILLLKRGDSLVAQLVKNLVCNEGDLGSIPGLGRFPGEGNCYPLQYSGLENFMDFIVHGGPKKLDITEQLSL